MGRRILFAIGLSVAFASQERYTVLRQKMVQEQIQSRDVRDPRVLAAMRETPRHLFVPEKWRERSYGDHPLPIGHGQTISQPYIVAAMTELLEPRPESKVLEIGTGSGYQTAVLSRVAGHVYSIEIVPELAKSATDLLGQLGHKNVTVQHGDGYQGWPANAPFDRIILTAAPPKIPQALLDQLKPGGKMVAPVGASSLDQELVVVEKSASGAIKRRSVFPVRFVPMTPGK